LRGIDAEISKFDPPAVGSCSIGLELALVQFEGQIPCNVIHNMGFTSKMDELVSIQGSPLEKNRKTRG